MKRRSTKRNPWPFSGGKAEASTRKRRRSQLTVAAAAREARAAGYRGRESFGEWIERKGLEERSSLVKDRLGDAWRAGVDQRERDDERKTQARESKHEARSSSPAQVEKLRDYSEKELKAHFEKGGTLASFLHGNPASYRGRSVAELERMRSAVAVHVYDNDFRDRMTARNELEKIDKALGNARKREAKRNPYIGRGHHRTAGAWPSLGVIDTAINRRAQAMARSRRAYTEEQSDRAADSLVRTLFGRNAHVESSQVDDIRRKLWNDYQSYEPGYRGYHLRRGKKRGNPADAADNAYSDFHGAAPTRETPVKTRRHFHKRLAEAGELRLLQIEAAAIDSRVKLTQFDGAMLTFNEKRNQLFITGGDQAVNLKAFGIDPDEAHEIETLGKVLKIGYYTDKKHLGDEGGQATYVHKFRSTNNNGKHVTVRVARYPDLIYYVRDKHLEFSGGSYRIIPEGIDL